MATFQKKVFTGLAAALLTLGSTGLNAAEGAPESGAGSGAVTQLLTTPTKGNAMVGTHGKESRLRKRGRFFTANLANSIGEHH